MRRYPVGLRRALQFDYGLGEDKEDKGTQPILFGTIVAPSRPVANRVPRGWRLVGCWVCGD
jgi:hypothetical protein